MLKKTYQHPGALPVDTIPAMTGGGEATAKRGRAARPPPPRVDDSVRSFIGALMNGKTPLEAAETAGFPPSAVRGLLQRRDAQAAVNGENRTRDRIVSHTPAKVESQLGNLVFSDIAAVLRDDGSASH